MIVVGSSGDYLTVADHVLQMDCYRIKDVTDRAKEISKKIPVPGDQDFRHEYLTDRLPEKCLQINMVIIKLKQVDVIH